MARKPMVTRTIITTKVNVLCLDTVDCEPLNKEVILPRTYKDKKAVVKKVREVIETETLKVADVVAFEEVETLYGMTEQFFIDNAIILDPETRKALETEEAETEE